MKGIILLFFLSFCSVVSATTYYVAPNGDDSNPGTFEQPWKSWGKAFNADEVDPGDTVYFRGGVYYKDLAGDYSWYYPSLPQGGTGYNVTRSGTAGNYVHYFAYPPDFNAGNKPILDCLDAYNPSNRLHYGIRNARVSYVHFYGLTTRNVNQVPGFGNSWAVGWHIFGSNLIIENCTFSYMWGAGLECGGATAPDFNYVINCDAYHCCDSLSTFEPGNDGSGFRHNSGGQLYYKDCRAWFCGDQGWSNYARGESANQYTVYDGCWSFRNGMLQGVGHGFKFGTIDVTDGNVKRTFKNCISAFNRVEGWTTLDYKDTYAVYVHMYNNIAYHNGYQGWTGGIVPGYGFNILNTLDKDENELKRIFKNNISYDNETGPVHVYPNALYTHDHNSWDIPLTITASDFVSLDSTGISGPRQEDGSLPDLKGFLKLSSTSKAIDAGVNVGHPYNNDAPDLGAYEYNSQPGTNMHPSVVLTSPSGGSTFTAPATITIIANASDADGTISKVEFFNGAVKLGEKTSGPWSFIWNNVPEGTYSLAAVATDNSDAKTPSSAVSITVNNSTPVTNQPLVITIINPIAGSTFTAPANITITVNVSDADVTVNKVEFFNGATKLGEKTSGPWSLAWNNVPEGTFSLTAVATDNLNAKTTSSAVSITVNDLSPFINQPPVVSIVNPSKGQIFKKYEDIKMDAVASDPDGTISKVEFYNGNNKLAEITTYPYSYIWRYVDEGNYSITAVATDNLNAATVSSPVWLEVEAGSFYDVNSEIFNLYPNPNDGHFSIVLTEPLQDGNHEITIITIDGKSIYKEPLLQEEIIKHFDLSYIKPGTYILILHNSIEIIATNKFIKN